MTRYAHFHPETAGVGITEKWVSASQVLVGTYCYNIDRPKWLVARLNTSTAAQAGITHLWMPIGESLVPAEYKGQALLLF
ncbi:MAG TPA: hypothetical protein VM783_07795 [Candidatus Acidoferrum sp.]|nr:hypothetical protein [Candidatus Acidoferrum sp.]